MLEADVVLNNRAGVFVVDDAWAMSHHSTCLLFEGEGFRRLEALNFLDALDECSKGLLGVR